MAYDTLLTLISMGVPLYSARGLSQTLTPIEAAKNLRRDINGELVDLSLPQFHKYETEITCSDARSPALDGVWPGRVLTVSCVAELAFETGSGGPYRTPVHGSEHTTTDGFTYYRPLLSMMVEEFQEKKDDWGVTVGWTLKMAEV
jgi:hypothetical protein